MNEAETRAELIDPALKAAGWGVVEASRVRREVITLGRLQGAGVRATPDIADYVLTYRNHKLAVIEAKRRGLPETEGAAQAKRYAEKLQTRFAYATNGTGIYQIDMTTGAEQSVAAYPTPDELWQAVFAEQNIWRDRFAAIPFEDDGGRWQPRYYIDIAIRRVLEAIVQGQQRILLTLATGTGKTSVAFHVAWKLFQSRWNLTDWHAASEPSRRPRILFLADRNILADQAYNSFSAFPEDALVRIDPEAIRKKGRVPKNGNIFFTIFQTFMTGRDAAGQPAPSFGDYPPESDFNRIIEIPERECYRVKLFMDAIDQTQKTLVFCATQDHALAVRDLVNQMKTSREPNYCVRVTANDGAEGERFLRIFQDNEKTIPTILTTSQKLSTGVDARNVRNIVLMRPINSMIEFKQIIGRGTRIFDGKDFFTIHDFVKAYEHFSDPEWDGEPIDPVEPPAKPDAGETDATAGDTEPPDDGDKSPRPEKIRIKLADGKERTIQHMTATSFWSPDGRPMSAAEFIARLFGELPSLFKDEDELRALWGQPDTRRALLDTLAERGFGGEQLRQVERMIDAEKSDLYDVLAHIAFASSPITRQERADTRKASIFAQYDPKLQAFLDFVLFQYVKEGVGELDRAKLPHLLELKYRAISDAAADLGGVAKIREAFVGFQSHLYAR